MPTAPQRGRGRRQGRTRSLRLTRLHREHQRLLRQGQTLPDVQAALPPALRGAVQGVWEGATGDLSEPTLEQLVRALAALPVPAPPPEPTGDLLLPPHTLTAAPRCVEVRFDDPDGSARTVVLIEATPEGVMLRVWNGDALAGSEPDLALPLEV